MTAAHPTVQGIVFIDGRVQLEPGCLATGAALLAAADDLGLVSGWIEEAAPEGRIHVPPLPSAPFGWHGGEVAPCVVVRADALGAERAQSRLQMFAGAASAGWTAVTYPGVWGSVVPGVDDALSRRDPLRYSSMAGAVQRLHTPILQWLRACSPAERRAFMAEGMRSPGRSVRWLAGRAVSAWRGPAGAAPRTATPSRDRDEDRANAERRAH